MTPKRKQCLYIVTAIVLLAALAVGLTLYALRANINAFYTPTQIANGEAPQGRQIRAGGMVRDGSVRRDNETLDAIFTVTDFDHDVTVHYQGILPDLFREGQGVVVMGTFDGDHLEASEVLAKHDEKYMPPEVSDALKASGRDVSGNRTGNMAGNESSDKMSGSSVVEKASREAQ
ncbi:cytochrome c maturation protein CcmE [Cobetia sp. cqz5-12]|uniref:cytochrome c maturation protein CcmE n=1 Tax=Cobetia sp. cqz5-12 TaxID=2609415 RepID=UPI001903F9C9|nr:cytochrome c maturation protein CcmE [Cobetia sp. cqz5-12]QQK63014.1 cytochrome c maturation protein CcmE [Cobetia sp. cqz5-12]